MTIEMLYIAVPVAVWMLLIGYYIHRMEEKIKRSLSQKENHIDEAHKLIEALGSDFRDLRSVFQCHKTVVDHAKNQINYLDNELEKFKEASNKIEHLLREDVSDIVISNRIITKELEETKKRISILEDSLEDTTIADPEQKYRTLPILRTFLNKPFNKG